MYGYVRPEKGELRIREYETFRGVYCGLCHTLKKRWGPLFRYVVNYDFTFLAMLLAGPEEVGSYARRCPYHPLRKTACPQIFPAMEAAADYSVILSYWKLRDEAKDSGFVRASAFCLLAGLIRPAFRRASELRPGFAEAIENNIRLLTELENDACPSIDAAADKFALILRAAGETDDPARSRVLAELLYHLGRIVYILDAADDLQDDIKKNNYNPLRYRFDVSDGSLSPEDAAELRCSLQLSHNSVSAAFELMEKNPYTDILSNIIYFGLPAVTQAVFSGKWRATAKERRKGNRL